MRKLIESFLLVGLIFIVGGVLVFSKANSATQAEPQQPAVAKPAAQTQEVQQKEGPVDLSIDSIRLFNDLYVGLPAQIEVAVVNNTDIQALNVGVGFAADEGSSDRQIIAVGPKARERVKLKWAPRSSGKHRIVVSIVSKFDTNPLNNQQAEFVEVSKETYIDVKIASAKIPPELSAGAQVFIEAEIANDADVEIREACVILNTDDGFKDLKRLTLRPKASEFVVFSWVPRNPGAQNISISVECKEDMNPGNNELKIPVEVKAVEGPAVTKPQSAPQAEEEKKETAQPKGNKVYFK